MQKSTAKPISSLHRRRITIALYVVVNFLFWMALYLYVPTLPSYVQGKVSNLAMVGVVLAMYGLWQGVVRLPVGIAADWLGRRKPFIIAGLLLAALGAWLMSVSGGAPGLLAGRAITGLAAAGFVPLVVAVSSVFKPHEAVRATALLLFVSYLGRSVATASTGWLTEWGGPALPFLAAAGAAILAVVVLLLIPEARLPSTRPSPGSIKRLVIRRDVLLPALLAAVIQYADFATTLGFSPIFARQLGASEVGQSMLVSLTLIVVLLGILAANPLFNRLGARRTVIFNFSLLTLGILLTAAAPSLAVLFGAQILLGLSVGLSYPVLMGLSIRHVDDAERNTAMGLHQSVYAVGMFAGPWISGVLAGAVGLRGMFAATAVFVLALGLVGAARLRD